MSHLALVAPAPRRGTASHDFFHSIDGNLLQVRQGADLSATLIHASCLLDTARASVLSVADEHQDNVAHGAAYLIELAQGLVNAAECGLSPVQSKADESPLGFLREALVDSQKQAGQARTAKMRTYHDGRASAFQIAIAALEG
ncbi:MAG: DUF3077 domain-containing protein [Zoogloea sp.]|nr:DUF3077 domain-containing protein [Zoogloea sp.]MCA0185089.1 DUF3077 domain-containing protein [Pseudomonadota bacterium]